MRANTPVEMFPDIAVRAQDLIPRRIVVRTEPLVQGGFLNSELTAVSRARVVNVVDGKEKRLSLSTARTGHPTVCVKHIGPETLIGSATSFLALVAQP
jgi:hypothetical protein